MREGLVVPDGLSLRTSSITPISSKQPTTIHMGRLDALTSLRFFAAAAIVLNHTGAFFVSATFLNHWVLQQGVTFFFVLSGFILTYTYPTLNRRTTRHFWMARFARIWPVHAAVLIATALLLGTMTRRFFVLDLLLLKAWVPNWLYIQGTNPVSWSLDNELFFYLCFPLLIWRWERTWAVKLAALLSVVAILILVSNRWPAQLSFDGTFLLVYFSPLMRILEFAVGIATAYLWRSIQSRTTWGRSAGTLFELAAVALALLVAYASLPWSMSFTHWRIVGAAGSQWLSIVGFVCIPFALVILVFGLGRGWLSTLLGWKPLVVLGEASFALYLIHQPLYRLYLTHPSPFLIIPWGWMYLVYWLLVLLIATAVWALVETPCRYYLVRSYDRFSGGRVALPGRPSFLTPSWWCGAGAAIVLGGTVLWSFVNPVTPRFDSLILRDTPSVVVVDTIAGIVLQPDGTITLSRSIITDGTVSLNGWAMDPSMAHTARGVYVTLDGTQIGRGEYGFFRADVGAYFNLQNLDRVGFSARIPLLPIPATHRLTIAVVGWDGKTYTESAPMIVNVV